jgi:hypothetical protein
MVQSALLCLLVVALANGVANGVANKALESVFSSATEKEAIEQLKQLQGTSWFKKDHLGQAMQHSWWELAERLIVVAGERGLNLESDFSMEQARLNNKISKLKSALQANRPKTKLAPSYKWAQTPDEIHVFVKFAHKIDAPAALNVKEEAFTLTNSSLVFEASNPQKRFTLTLLDLLKEIDSEGSSVTFGSVGTCTIVLAKKQKRRRWARLTKSRIVPRNAHIWFEMREKYEEEMKQVEKEAVERQKAKKEAKESQEVKTEGKETGVEKEAGGGAAKTAEQPAAPTSTEAAPEKVAEEGAGTAGAATEVEKVESEKPSEKQSEKQRHDKRVKAVDDAAKVAIKKLEEETRQEKQSIDADCTARKTAVDEAARVKRAGLLANAEVEKNRAAGAAGTDEL